VAYLGFQAGANNKYVMKAFWKEKLLIIGQFGDWQKSNN
jgi:hypothetical protein